MNILRKKVEEMEPRNKQLFFAVLTASALTLCVLALTVAVITNEAHRYILAFGMFLLVVVGFSEIRRSRKEEMEELERQPPSTE
jgi:hypothetical protein